MEFSQLRTLVCVAELGSLSKASDRLRIAQPALSRQVRMLEEELGVALFTRHGRGMVLTEQGRDVLKHATRIAGEMEEIRASASNVDAPLSASEKVEQAIWSGQLLDAKPDERRPAAPSDKASPRHGDLQKDRRKLEACPPACGPPHELRKPRMGA